jgi:ATP-binding cassette subfamily B protein
MKKYYGMLIMAVALLFVQAMCDLTLPDYMSDIVNDGVLGGSIPLIVEYGTKMVGITLLGTAASVSVGYLAANVAARTARDMRKDVYKKVELFSNAEFDKFSSASLITRTTNDITQIQMLLVMLVRMVFYAPILGVGGAIKAVDSSKSLSWIIIVSILAIVALIVFMLLVAMPKMQLMQKLVDRLNLVSRENIEGMLVIRAFNSQEFEYKRFDKANGDLKNTQLFVNRIMVMMSPIMMLIMNLTNVLIVWFGSKAVSEFKIDIGTMMAFMQYAIQIIMAFLMLSMMFILIPRAAVSAKRVQEVLDTPITMLNKKKAQIYDDNDFSGDVEFKNVSFAYPGGDEYVLKDINFTAKHGQTTAIIGATGSGKSTLVNLIMRFYDIQEGSVIVSGKDVRDVKMGNLRKHIGYVPQKSVLFSGTIKSNLYYGDKNASDEVIDKAAEISQSEEFISSKPQGYDTHIAQGGGNVSGGQKQRLSIARALVKNAPIYIFDDSFSALDMKTDKILRAALKRETGDSTFIIVAQRVGTIMNAEQIIVLDNGRIVGKGTHKELLKNCPTYYQIASSQLSEKELNNA